MKIASHENLNFLEEILIAICQHRQNSQDQEQENKLPPTQENSPPTQENNEIELPPISLGDQFKALPCYQLTSDKMPLVENNGIYIERMIYASIPHVTPQLIQDKGKKMADDGSLFPRGMIKYLYELLVPEVIRKVAEPSDIPQDIKFVIKSMYQNIAYLTNYRGNLTLFVFISAYINLRLPPTVKLIDTKLNEALYDICRKEKKKQIKS
ncbi:uncharacterized protein LOC117643341 [Thrips palmi]|uniref:Uncharacterized protein LOC117643341 n=1 Tax=Thrips palmi TaxID=161013 RepID=A0A6P8YVC9_THRPL|nr:uncharacterized protein LOC117643341 [Thrips palmi]